MGTAAAMGSDDSAKAPAGPHKSLSEGDAHVKAPAGLPERLFREIRRLARKSGIERVILFGSRARGTNGERSDVDLAARGGDFDSFYWDVKEGAHTLLRFDVVNLDDKISGELRREIEAEGVVIYEKD